MEYKTYGGLTLVVEDEALVVRRRSGRQTARDGAIARRIPLHDISDVSLRPATPMQTGFIILGLQGRQALPEAGAPHSLNPDAFEFTSRQQGSFAALHDWLLHVVRVNQSAAALPTPEPRQDLPGGDDEGHGLHNASVSDVYSSRTPKRPPAERGDTYKGYGVSVVVTQDRLVVQRRGPARVVQRLDKETNHALEFITAARLTPATRMTNGFISLGHAGLPIAAKSRSDAVSDPDSIMFTYQQREAFNELHRRLHDLAKANVARALATAPTSVDLSTTDRSGIANALRIIQELLDDFPEFTPTDPPPNGLLADGTPIAVDLRWVPPAHWSIGQSYDPPPTAWMPDEKEPDPGHHRFWQVIGPQERIADFTHDGVVDSGPGMREREVSTQAGRLTTLNAYERLIRRERLLRSEWAEIDEEQTAMGRPLPPDHPAVDERARVTAALIDAAVTARDHLVRSVRCDLPPSSDYFTGAERISPLLRETTDAARAVASAYKNLRSVPPAAAPAPYQAVTTAASASDWMQAEQLAAAAVQQFGFADARVTPPGADGGLDVIARGAAAQVKYTSTPVGRPTLQQLQGAAGGRSAIFFSRSGYARTAVAFADQVDMALFTITLPTRVTAVNDAAVRLVQQQSS